MSMVKTNVLNLFSSFIFSLVSLNDTKYFLFFATGANRSDEEEVDPGPVDWDGRLWWDLPGSGGRGSEGGGRCQVQAKIYIKAKGAESLAVEGEGTRVGDEWCQVQAKI